MDPLTMAQLAMMAYQAVSPKPPGTPEAPKGEGISMSPTAPKPEDVFKPESPVDWQFMSQPSGINGEIQKANAGKNVGYPLTPTEAGKAGTGALLEPGAFEAVGTDKKKGGMSFDEKMQMAAMAAQLGSALSGPGAPPPPSAPRGGGIQMTPTFMSARGIYG